MNFGTSFAAPTLQQQAPPPPQPPPFSFGGGFGQPQTGAPLSFFQPQPPPPSAPQLRPFSFPSAPPFAPPPAASAFLPAATAAPAPFAPPPPQPPACAPVTLKTKYADLPDVYKKEVDAIAQLIRTQISAAETLHVSEIDNMLCDITTELDDLKKSRGAIEASLQNDHYTIENLRSIVRKEMDRVEIATRIIDAEKKGPSLDLRFNRVYSTLDYFYEKEEEFRRQAEKHAQRLSELEDHVRSLTRVHTPSPQTLLETVRAQNNSFLLLASRVADLHNAIERTREAFLVYWPSHFGSQDPPTFAGSLGTGDGSGGGKRAAAMEDAPVVSFKDYANQFVDPTPLPAFPAAALPLHPAGAFAPPAPAARPVPAFAAAGAPSFTTASGSTGGGASASGPYASSATGTFGSSAPMSSFNTTASSTSSTSSSSSSSAGANPFASTSLFRK